MGIDVKETGAILWKVLGFSMNTSLKFMRNHPMFSGVSMFLLMLYILLPSLFFFLIYSSPVLACGVAYAREKLGFTLPSSGPKGCERENDGVRRHLREQRSVRRNARLQVEEWDSQTSEEEKDKVILTPLYNDLLGRTPKFEESPKAIETEVVENINEKSFDEGESRMSSRDLCYLNVEEPKVCNSEIKEETREEMSNANEHGVSVIDRDKRLESLIARRRTRRLFKLALDQHNKLQAQETSSPTQNNHLQINVPRRNNNNSFEKRQNYPSDDSTFMGLQVPSSAPSVMLQARNPFDIPYDPQEERPILSGDSFDQEFSFFDHKDMFLSRHESFSRLDVLSPEHAQCPNSPGSTSDITTTKKRLDLQKENMDHNEETTIEDDNKCVESGELEVNNETDSNNEDDDDSSCSEESESEVNRFNKAELKEAISHTMDKYPGFLVNQARNGIPSPLPRGPAPPKLDDNNMFYARKRENSHSRTFSMASDMQVEFSEIGSPPTTVDWPDEWSNDGESSYIYDTDIDREVLIRGEESRKRVSSQCESKEEDSLVETEPVVEQDKKWLVAEHLRTADDLYRRIQAEERPSGLSGVSRPTRGLSLSSITEEPETIFDSVDGGGTSENVKILTTDLVDLISLPSLDSYTKKLLGEEVIDVQPLENNDVASLDPYIERETNDKEEEEPELNDFTKEVTTQTEDNALQGNLNITPCQVLTKLVEHEGVEEKGPEPERSNDEYAKTVEPERTHDVVEASSSQPYIQLLEDHGSEENGSDVLLLQVQDSNNSTLDESDEHVLSKEGEISRLLKDFQDKSDVEEESTVIYPNTVSQDIVKDIFAAPDSDSTVTEKNDEEQKNLQPDEQVIEEAVERDIELNSQPMHHNTGLVAKEEDEEPKKVKEALHNAETTTTKTETET